MNTTRVDLQQPDGIYPEFGKAVYRFPRSIKEGCNGFADLSLSEDEFVQKLNDMERSMRPLFYLVIGAALLMIALHLMGAIR